MFNLSTLNHFFSGSMALLAIHFPSIYRMAA